jgi:hypothetical protein
MPRARASELLVRGRPDCGHGAATGRDPRVIAGPSGCANRYRDGCGSVAVGQRCLVEPAGDDRADAVVVVWVMAELANDVAHDLGDVLGDVLRLPHTPVDAGLAGAGPVVFAHAAHRGRYVR